MIRKQAPSKSPALYRHLFKDAFLASWHNRHLWPLALFAGILQTAGIFDTILASGQGVQFESMSWLTDGSIRFLAHLVAALSSSSHFSGFLTGVALVQNLVISLTILFAILSFSIISQGGLVYAINQLLKGTRVGIREALGAGVKYAQPIALINILSVLFLWVARTLVMLPAMQFVQAPTIPSVVLYLVTFLIFFAATVLVTSVHMLSLNAIVIDKANVSEAIHLSLDTFKKHWLIVLESGFILLLIGVAMLILGFVGFLIFSIPLFILLNITELTAASTLSFLGTGLAALLFLCTMLAVGAWNVSLNYGVWERMYFRFVNHAPKAKLHRAINWLFPNN